eukprot:scaffold5661_cov33-Tisochrysis_lutea.AAC.1
MDVQPMPHKYATPARLFLFAMWRASDLCKKSVESSDDGGLELVAMSNDSAKSAHPHGQAGQVAWARPMNHNDLRREIDRRHKDGVRHSDMYVKTGRHGRPDIQHGSFPKHSLRERRFYEEDVNGLARSITVLDMGDPVDYRRAKELD